MIEKSGQGILPFLTFSGNAEEVMNFYVSVFPDARVVSLTHFSEKDPGKTGKVLNGTFELKGRRFMVMDMEKQHAPAFSWAISMYVECDDEEEFDTLFSKLSEGGMVMMGPEPVLNLRKVAWVTDRFDVT